MGNRVESWDLCNSRGDRTQFDRRRHVNADLFTENGEVRNITDLAGRRRGWIISMHRRDEDGEQKNDNPETGCASPAAVEPGIGREAHLRLSQGTLPSLRWKASFASTQVYPTRQAACLFFLSLCSESIRRFLREETPVAGAGLPKPVAHPRAARPSDTERGSRFDPRKAARPALRQ